jgi:hypothetical protein
MEKANTIEIKRKSGRAKPVLYQVMDKPPPKKSPVGHFFSFEPGELH